MSASASTTAAESGLAISFTDVEKRYGSHVALRRLSLKIAPGEFVALVGANGSGKTTLLRMAALLSRPTSGKVEFQNAVPTSDALTPAEIKLRIGMVGHFTMLYDELSAEENLRFFASLYGLNNPHKIAAESLIPAGLSARAKDLVRTFSRGMRQRLAIARALLANPSILLFDEPAAGLDREGASWLAQTLSALRKSGATVIMSSHGQSEALTLATRAIAMRGGTLIEDSGPNGNARAIIEREAAPIVGIWDGAQ
nr:ABC transporter ATP-binding protein [Candidatus Acidoferrales bacterium]